MSGEKPDGPSFVRRVTGKLGRSSGVQVDEDLWASIQLARHAERPYTLDYINRITSDFEEMHGDRLFGDDPAMVAGFGRFNDRAVAFVGQQKGRDTNERTYRNFGMASPEGYRKSMRVMEIANHMGMPIVTLIDTPGAFPGASAEERGQGGAISRSMQLARRTGGGRGHRRGFIGWCAGPRHRRSGADAREQHIFGDQPRRCVGHSVARCIAGQAGGAGI